MHSDGMNDVPQHFICPISLEMMEDPVTLCTGHTFDRRSIQQWFDVGRTSCPSTMQQCLHDLSLTPNHSLARLIHQWRLQQHSLLLHNLLHNVQAAKDEIEKVSALEDIRSFLQSKPSPTDIFVSKNDVDHLLQLLSDSSMEVKSGVLSILAASHPFYISARRSLAHSDILFTIISLLENGNLSTKHNALHLINHFLKDQQLPPINTSNFRHLIEAVQPSIGEEKDPAMILAGLSIFKSMVTDYKWHILTIMNDLVAQLVCLLSHSDPRIMEMALDILDKGTNTVEGREALRNCPTAIVKLVGVMIKQSDICTELVVSILLALCLHSSEEVSMKAVDAGLLPKLLLVVQSGCSDQMKQRCVALMNLVAKDCIDSRGSVLNGCNLSQTFL